MLPPSSEPDVEVFFFDAELELPPSTDPDDSFLFFDSGSSFSRLACFS